MTKVVISQPMYFPWYGHLEQLKHCDVYVFYDDVQFSRGFFNRVQLKKEEGQAWMTVPLEGGESRKEINSHIPSKTQDWRASHAQLFKSLYHSAPFYEMAAGILEQVLTTQYEPGSLSDFSEASTMALAVAFGLNHARYLKSSELDIPGKGTQRLVDICKALSASEYITGHGARNYMDHGLFDSHGINVSYISYGMKPYPQHIGNHFIPYVSGLDCIANCGPEAHKYLGGSLLSWRTFLAGSSK